MQEPSAPSVTTIISVCGPSASAASRALQSCPTSADASDLVAAESVVEQRLG